MKYVLFVCNHNAGRSQIAQAFFERHAPHDIRAESAGSSATAGVWPAVVEAMAEVGIDISARKPRKLLLGIDEIYCGGDLVGYGPIPTRSAP
jgi:arsenate reductase